MGALEIDQSRRRKIVFDNLKTHRSTGPLPSLAEFLVDCKLFITIHYFPDSIGDIPPPHQLNPGGAFFNHLSNPDGSLAMPNEGPSLDSCLGHSAPIMGGGGETYQLKGRFNDP